MFEWRKDNQVYKVEVNKHYWVLKRTNINNQKLRPVHPDEILKEELLIPRGISQAELARGIKASTKRVNEICQGKRGITPDIALRLAFYFNLGKEGVEFWINLQQNYEKCCWKNILVGKEKQLKIKLSHEEAKFSKYFWQW